MGVGADRHAYGGLTARDQGGYAALAVYLVGNFLAVSQSRSVLALAVAGMVGFVAAMLLGGWWIVPIGVGAAWLGLGGRPAFDLLIYGTGAVWVALPPLAGLLVSALRASRVGADGDALVLRSSSFRPPPLTREKVATGAYFCLLLGLVTGIGDDNLLWLVPISGLAAGFLNPSPLVPLASATAVLFAASAQWWTPRTFTQGSARQFAFLFAVGVLPSLLGMAAAFFRGARPRQAAGQMSSTLMTTTYLLLAAITIMLFAFGNYPGLFAPGSGPDPDLARRAAIDAWHTRYLAIGLPGTLVVAAVAAAWVRSFARSKLDLAWTLGPAALLGMTTLWPYPVLGLLVAVTFVAIPWGLVVAALTLLAVAAAARFSDDRVLHPIAFWIATVWAAELAVLSLQMSTLSLG
jgi:hypothetical protein